MKTEEYEADASETSLKMSGRMTDCRETYTVTATMNGVESEHSNMITVDAINSIIGVDANDSETQYFSADGIRLMSKPTVSGVYVVRKGGKTSKITIR